MIDILLMFLWTLPVLGSLYVPGSTGASATSGLLPDDELHEFSIAFSKAFRS
jgi:hypothetical protein